MSDIAFIRRNLKGMAVSGLWDFFRFKNPVKNFLFMVYGKLVYFTFFCFNTSQFIEMYNVKDDFPMLMQNAGVTLLYGVLILKTYTIMFRKNRIEQLLDRLRFEEIRALKRPQEEVNTYMESVDQNWFITRLFWFVCFSTILLFNVARPAEYFALGPQEIHHYKIPMLFSSWFPFDNYADGNFKYAYGYQILSGCIGAYYVGVSDTLIVAFMIFAIGQFRLIQCSIRNLHNLTDEEKMVYNTSNVIDLYPKVVDVIKHHCRIIEYLDDLDDLINPIILMNFLVCSIMICAVGLEGIIAGPSIRFALQIYYLLALLVQLFLFYWHANEVTLESTPKWRIALSKVASLFCFYTPSINFYPLRLNKLNITPLACNAVFPYLSVNVGQAVCESEWFNFSPRAKKALLMILTRTQRPSVLSVGGFYPMSLSTFLMILRATYSYLALFRKMYSREDED